MITQFQKAKDFTENNYIHLKYLEEDRLWWLDETNKQGTIY